MELFQILDCSSLDTCCNDPGLVGILSITIKIFELIQIVVPIILILAGTIQFVQLTVNPELKDGFRKVLNKVIAAIIIFLLPVLMDAILTATSSNFSISSCWKQSKTVASGSIFGGGTYSEIETTDDSVWLDPKSYESEVKDTKFVNPSGTGTNTGTSTGTSNLRQEIVSYAMQFKGKPYAAVGCVWNGNLPYRATDCIGFVKGVYSHFGIKSMKNAPCGTQSLYRARSGILTQVSEKDAKPADIVLWKGHIAIYLGDGKIIHAAGKKYGVITQKLYKNGEFRGFFRVNGVE